MIGIERERRKGKAVVAFTAGSRTFFELLPGLLLMVSAAWSGLLATQFLMR